MFGKHRNKNKEDSRSGEIHTLYVYNILEDRDHLWLLRTFNKFGKVKDTFIPWKRSKNTGNRFGFVKYYGRVAAEMAISKLNGVWVDYKRLYVKEAFFGLYQTKVNQKEQRTYDYRNLRPDKRRIENNQGQIKSYSKVVQGETSKLNRGRDVGVSMMVEAAGNG